MTTDPAACDHIYATQAKLPHRYCWRCGLSEEEIMEHEMNKQAAAIVETEKQKLVKPTSDPVAMPDDMEQALKIIAAQRDFLKAYQGGKYELYAMSADIRDAAMKHLPASEGPLDRATRQILKDRPPHSDTKGVDLEKLKREVVEKFGKMNGLKADVASAVIDHLHAQGYLRGQDAPPGVDLDEHKQALWMVDNLLKDSIPLNVIEKVVGILEWIAEDNRERYMRYGDSAPNNGREMQAKAKVALAALAPYRKAGDDV